MSTAKPDHSQHKHSCANISSANSIWHFIIRFHYKGILLDHNTPGINLIILSIYRLWNFKTLSYFKDHYLQCYHSLKSTLPAFPFEWLYSTFLISIWNLYCDVIVDYMLWSSLVLKFTRVHNYTLLSYLFCLLAFRQFSRMVRNVTLQL